DGGAGHPHLPGVDRRAAVEHPVGRRPGPEARHRGARRGPLRPRRRQGPGAGVPGRPAAPRPQDGRGGGGLRRVRRVQAEGGQGDRHAVDERRQARRRAVDHRRQGGEGQGDGARPDPAVRRPAGRRQDVDRQVDRPRPGAEVRPRGPRRHPRRGRHPRPPADLRRRHARPDHPGPQAGRHQEPRLPARRGRQAGRLVPGRPRQRAFGSPRPGAERHVHGQLSERAVRPERGPLRGHRELHPEHPRPAFGPDGGGGLRRLHRAREGRDRQDLPHPPPARGIGPDERGGLVHRRGRGGRRRRVHPRERRAPARTPERRRGPHGRPHARRRRADRPDPRPRGRPRAARPAQGPPRARGRRPRGRRGDRHVLHP
ncbi:hypothetical protein HK102_012543, partial [Quaeritorhiza haematococci]